MEKRYLLPKEVAKLIRKTLKAAFPSTKFSVRTSRSSSINIDWTDGPTIKEVDNLVKVFEGASFDGMCDLESPNYHEIDGVPVSLGTRYVFAHREISDELREKTKKYVDNLNDDEIYELMVDFPHLTKDKLLGHVLYNTSIGTINDVEHNLVMTKRGADWT